MKPAVIHVLGAEEEVVLRHPRLLGSAIAYVIGQPSTAQIGPTPRVAWGRLDGEHGPIEPADLATADLLDEPVPVLPPGFGPPVQMTMRTGILCPGCGVFMNDATPDGEHDDTCKTKGRRP